MCVCARKKQHILSSTKSWWEFLPKYIMLRRGKKVKQTYIRISRVLPEQSDISQCLHAEPAKTFERPHWGSYCSENQLIAFDICWSLEIQKRIIPDVLQQEGTNNLITNKFQGWMQIKKKQYVQRSTREKMYYWWNSNITVSNKEKLFLWTQWIDYFL